MVTRLIFSIAIKTVVAYPHTYPLRKITLTAQNEAF
jgi:hypothetical protein